jgi:nucleoside-diphosphate-sugar epimerase
MELRLARLSVRIHNNDGALFFKRYATRLEYAIKDISIDELAEMIRSLIGNPGELDIEGHRFRPEKSEVMQLLADTRLAKELFGWSPAYSLEEGLVETVEWYRKNLSRLKVGGYPL